MADGRRLLGELLLQLHLESVVPLQSEAASGLVKEKFVCGVISVREFYRDQRAVILV